MPTCLAEIFVAQCREAKKNHLPLKPFYFAKALDKSVKKHKVDFFLAYNFSDGSQALTSIYDGARKRNFTCWVTQGALRWRSTLKTD